MARTAGRFGRFYIAIASGGTPEPVPFIAKFTVNQTTARYDATSLGDTSKATVAGLPDAQGTYDGFIDPSSAQVFTAAQDGLPRPFYFYTNTADGAGGRSSAYWSGTAFFDATITVDIGGVETLSGTWSGTGNVVRTN